MRRNERNAQTELELAQLSQPENYRKYTVEEIARALLEHRGLYAPAAQSLGASRATIARYVDEYPELKDAVRTAREAQIDFAESQLFAAIKDREPWAIAFYLKTQAKHRGYIERSESVRINIDVSLVQRLEAAAAAAGIKPEAVIEAIIEQMTGAPQLPAPTPDDTDQS